jgi:hypothetical protein
MELIYDTWDVLSVEGTLQPIKHSKYHFENAYRKGTLREAFSKLASTSLQHSKGAIQKVQPIRAEQLLSF